MIAPGLLAGVIRETGIGPLTAIERRLLEADQVNPVVTDTRLLLLAAELLQSLKAVEDQCHRLASWLPTAGPRA